MRPVKIGNKGNPFYNGSGYPDPTAYAAIKKTDQERKKSMSQKDDFMRGDIFEMENGKGDTVYFVVIAVFSNYISGLQLLNSPDPERRCAVKARSMMYTDPGRVTYVYKDRLGDFVRALTDEELSGLLDTVGQALSLWQGKDAETAPPKAAPAEPDAPTPEEPQQPSNDDMAEITIGYLKATAERDTYKDLYADLLAKVMEVRA